ncbi:MAG: GNAT family N-acetyltransferase [Alphaproteobacteria bacterium]|nr:GNAT family N-acetyltransferase [Alphaproteobacteria bacterium]
MSEIETPALRLRRFRMADAPGLARLYTDDVIMRYMLPGKGLAKAEAETRARANITNFNAHWDRLGFGVWAMEERQGGRLIGQCGLRQLDEIGEVEVLYLLNKTVWGRGLATQAAAAALDFGFRTIGLRRIVGFTNPANAASRRVLEKIGLRFERLSDELWNTMLAWHAVELEDWLAAEARSLGEPAG